MILNHQFQMYLIVLLIMINPGMVVPERALSDYKNPEAVNKLAVAQNAFTLALYKELASDNKGNLFFSPLSIMTALSMVHAGAAGGTSQEIEKVLHLPKNTSEVHSAFEEIITDFKDLPEGSNLSIGNAAYVQKEVKLLENFKSDLRKTFKSEIESVDFNDPESVCDDINNYIKNKTANKIQELISSDMIDSNTRMVLVNAVYFKGLWEQPFDKKDTVSLPFWSYGTTEVSVETMKIKKKFRYGVIADLNAEVLEMNYTGSFLSMVLLLPKEKNGLVELEKKLENFNLTTLGDNLSDKMDVSVSIPKFKLEEKYETLKKTLTKMGMPSLFDMTKCDLSGITGARDLVVSSVVHKAFVEVNEEGSEAAASSGITISRRMVFEEDTFIADHPFQFFIVDKRSGLVLFAGRVSDPPRASHRVKEEL